MGDRRLAGVCNALGRDALRLAPGDWQRDDVSPRDQLYDASALSNLRGIEQHLAGPLVNIV